MGKWVNLGLDFDFDATQTDLSAKFFVEAEQ
jgi:hypothetical protein